MRSARLRLKNKAQFIVKNIGFKIILLGFIFISLNLLLVSQAGAEDLPNPLGTTDIGKLLVKIIIFILRLTAIIAVSYFIYGGLTWMTAGGNSDKIRKGKDIIVWAVLGLVVIFTSYIIINFVFESLKKVGEGG